MLVLVASEVINEAHVNRLVRVAGGVFCERVRALGG